MRGSQWFTTHPLTEEEEEHVEADPQANAFQKGGMNKQLVVSKERSYVENRGRIGVFKNSNVTGELQYIATINRLVSPNGRPFVPKKVCLDERISLLSNLWS
jgi:VID27 C-terminal WD40-like domain